MLYLLLLPSCTLYGQEHEETNVQNTIERFFEGFHEQDSVTIRQTIHSDMRMQSIEVKDDGTSNLTTIDLNTFLNSIIGIPKGITFREKILDYSIQVDGSLAQVWTPYEFYIDGNLSHSGVNSFQMFKDNGDWKIIYIVDTRR